MARELAVTQLLAGSIPVFHPIEIVCTQIGKAAQKVMLSVRIRLRNQRNPVVVRNTTGEDV